MQQTYKVKATPYNISGKSKSEEVELMFNNIAPKYDFLNNLLSLGIDKLWRKRVVKMIGKLNASNVLDVATGTAELAIAIGKGNPNLRITGIDISQGMLDIGKKKLQDLKLNSNIELLKADSEKLPFNNNTFDVVTVAFGVRNFEHLEDGLKEIFRVLKNNGTFIVLEFSKPSSFPMKQLFGFYFKVILPFIGNKISKDSRAYSYLPESVSVFPEGKNFTDILDKCNFKGSKVIRLSGGIASIYTAKK